MKTQRRFRPEFKRQVIEELLSGVSSPGQIVRRYKISSGLLYHWKKQYTKGALENPPDQTAALEERVRQLEQLVGKLTLEIEFLKKAVQRPLEPSKRSGSSLPTTETCSKPSQGGAGS
jgi:transposase